MNRIDIMKLATCVACVAFLAAETQAFVGNPQSQPRSSRHHQLHHGIGVARQAPSTFLSRLRRSPFSPLYQSTQDNADTVNAPLEEEVRSMRVKEIKAELENLNVSTADAFEKEELVKRLVQARIKNGVSSGGNPSSNASTSPKEDPIISTPQSTSAATNTEGSSSSATDKVSSDNVIVAPLYFTTVDAGRVAAGVTIQSSDRPYATIQVDVSQSQSSQSSSKFPLNLLLDTACSGFVLRPSVVEKYKLPQLSTPVTMTGAGGSVGATGLTQVESFSVSTTTPASPTDTNVNDFGPMPAAVQDITGLPTALDGIIGLSFLNQFACVDMDFAKGTVSLYKRGTTPPADGASSKIVGQANMEYISSLGLYTVGVYLGDKGPVKMLVDSGASNTFISWKGVQDLGLSRDSPLLQRNSGAFGAVGSDNVAMELTHRVTVGSSLKIASGEGGPKSEPGVSLQEDARNLRIDIGDIGILEQLRDDGVGGILGVDALMRCSSVRFDFGVAGSKEMILYE